MAIAFSLPDHDRAVERQRCEAMRFSSSWPLLGLLVERPSYGYELVRRLERVYGDALDLNLRNPKRTYQALEELQERNLIEPAQDTSRRPKPVTPRKPRIYYAATEQGVAAYQDWLVDQVEQQRRRSWIFSRQLAMLDPQDALVVIDRFERECLEEAGNDNASAERETLVDRLAREDERVSLNVALSWLEFARRELTTPTT